MDLNFPNLRKQIEKQLAQKAQDQQPPAPFRIEPTSNIGLQEATRQELLAASKKFRDEQLANFTNMEEHELLNLAVDMATVLTGWEMYGKMTALAPEHIVLKSAPAEVLPGTRARGRPLVPHPNCKAITAEKLPCRGWAMDGSVYCLHHAKMKEKVTRIDSLPPEEKH